MFVKPNQYLDLFRLKRSPLHMKIEVFLLAKISNPLSNLVNIFLMGFRFVLAAFLF